MFDICLKRPWAVSTKAALDLCKMVEKRMWKSMTPLRQFKGVPPEVVREAAGKQFPWYRYFNLTPPGNWRAPGNSERGLAFHRLVHTFPKLQLQAQVQLITRSLLRIDLSIVPDFRWDEKVHGTAETFIILVQDVDVDVILFHDTFVLRQRYAEDAHNASLTVPMFEPAPANQYISDISDCWLHWLHAETHLPISFQHLILPKKFPKPTPLLDLHATSTFRFAQQRVRGDIYAHYPNIQQNPDSSSSMHRPERAPTGSGKTIAAEFARSGKPNLETYKVDRKSSVLQERQVRLVEKADAYRLYSNSVAHTIYPVFSFIRSSYQYFLYRRSVPIRRGYENTLLCRIYDCISVNLNQVTFKAPQLQYVLPTTSPLLTPTASSRPYH
ncbi:Sec63 Brl domain-containing protein [Pholiota molesta]|nr:Sec63 Brl domain-containing protein [Pholiota molesta]